MTGKPISDQAFRARIDALNETKNEDGTFNTSRAATKLGLSRGALQHFMSMNKEALLTTQAEEVGFPAEGVSNYWVKTKEGSYHVKRDVAVDVIQTIKEHFADYKPKPAPRIDKSKSKVNTDVDTLTLYPLADLHLGLLAWGKESERDWDLPIAIEAYQNAMQKVADASPASERAIILGGGDLLHSDNYKPLTPVSGNFLDVDSRFPKILKAAIDLLVFQIDLVRKKHKSVTVRILPGNHDITAAIAVTYALHGYFRGQEEFVRVDLDPGLFWFYPFENVLIGATHGHAAKVNEMPLIMANRVPSHWAASRHRFVHTFHVHHKSRFVHEGGGVIAETHQSPVSQDAYHYGKGYLSGRSMQSITYHREHGEVARSTVAMV
jgi:hypothetical protein